MQFISPSAEIARTRAGENNERKLAYANSLAATPAIEQSLRVICGTPRYLVAGTVPTRIIPDIYLPCAREQLRGPTTSAGIICESEGDERRKNLVIAPGMLIASHIRRSRRDRGR